MAGLCMAGFLVFVGFFFLMPVGVCILHHFHPRLFLGLWRKFAFAAVYSFLSWSFILSAIFLSSCFGNEIRGPELCFAFFFGWIYIWVPSLPIFLFYGAFLLLKNRLPPVR